MHKYLVVGPAWVGDMVMAQSLFKQLKKQTPDAIIDVLAPSWTAALLDFMPEVNKAIIVPCAHGEWGLMKRYRLGVSLRKNGYTHAIVLPNSFKSAWIPFFARVPTRTGWLGEIRWGFLNEVRILNKIKLPKMVQRFVALALPRFEYPDFESIVFPKLEVTEKMKENVLEKVIENEYCGYLKINKLAVVDKSRILNK